MMTMIDGIDLLLAATNGASEQGGLYGLLLKWARINSTWQLILVIFGLVAQVVFFGRWLVQWIASERRGESHMPEIFWWLSLVGATMLLVYFILRQEPVGVVGQAVGWTVYGRNLYLIRRKRAQHLAEGPGGVFEPEA